MKKGKKIVVTYWGDDWHKEIPLAKAIPTRESFEDWHRRGLKHNIEIFRASLKWYDKRKNVFNKAWAFRNEKWIKIEKPIKPSLIFDKIAGKRDYQLLEEKIEISRKVPIFNYPLFRLMFDNKLSQYLIFGRFMPKSFVAKNKKEYLKALKKVNSKKAVVKPFFGSGGFGITIDEKKKLLSLTPSFPVMIQEFIKSEQGIPGFSRKKEVADLRLVFMNHKLVYALSRIAKNGSLFTNFHQGATAILVPLKYIPKSISKVSSEIVEKLSLFPQANYSLDFIFTNKGEPVFIEMNTTPGFDLLNIVGDEEIKENNFKEFINILND